MNLTKTELEGDVILEPSVFEDSRGFFMESYNAEVMKSLGITDNFVQDNQSSSTYGVVRGLHFQIPPVAQSKLVRVLKGKILDIAVDIRKNSPTYGKHVAIELSEENKKQLYLPRGFAHGFSVLSEFAEVLYKCDNFYSKEHERGFVFNDPDLNIDWKVNEENWVISEKDKNNPAFKGSEYYY